MIQFDAQVVNVHEIRTDLIRMLAQLGPKAEARFLRSAGKIAQRRIRQSLAQGGPGWAPLKTSTLERRLRGGLSKGVRKHGPSKWSTHEKRAHERLLYGGLTAREAKKAGTWYEPPDAGVWTTTSEKFNRARFSPLPLGGPQGTFARVVRVMVGDGRVYIGPPERMTGSSRKKNLYELFRIHKRGGPGLPSRELSYLQPEDIKRVEQVAEAIIDRALKIVKSGKGGRASSFFRADLTG